MTIEHAIAKRRRAMWALRMCLVVLGLSSALLGVSLIYRSSVYWGMTGEQQAFYRALSTMNEQLFIASTIVLLVLAFAAQPFRRELPGRLWGFMPLFLGLLAVSRLPGALDSIGLLFTPWDHTGEQTSVAAFAEWFVVPIRTPLTVLGVSVWLLVIALLMRFLFAMQASRVLVILVIGAVGLDFVTTIGWHVMIFFMKEGAYLQWEYVGYVSGGTALWMAVAYIWFAKSFPKLLATVDGSACPRCRYSLTGITSTDCPECGTHIEHEINRILGTKSEQEPEPAP